MHQNCKICGVEFDSEGHTLTEWLTLCHSCNSKYKGYQEREDKCNEHIQKIIKDFLEHLNSSGWSIADEDNNKATDSIIIENYLATFR